MSTAKEKYRVLCAQQPSIPLFSRDWWLDSVAEDTWDVVLVERGGQIVASMPYVVKKRLGFAVLSHPPLTQNLGPWLLPISAKYAKRLGQEKDLLQELFEQLPHFSHFQQNWHFTRTNWLPVYWKGFEQTTKYTYRIESLRNLDAIWEDFQANIRTDVRKAMKSGVKIRSDLKLDEFLELNEKVFLRQGKRLPYAKDLVYRLDAAADERSCRQIFIAEDEQGRHHAGVYLVWDDKSAYYLMGGGDPDLRNSGATSLCMWEAIKFSSSINKSFDFEGSMIEPVERFFRAFGAQQTPYFTVSKTASLLIKAYRILKA